MSKILNYSDFFELLKKEKRNIKVKITEDFKPHKYSTGDINPKGTILWFGLSNDKSFISTFNGNTESKNREFGYTFDYAWLGSWKTNYNGKFELVEDTTKTLIKNKMEIEDLKKIDPKILKLAKEEVEKERAEKQQKEAEEVLRGLLNRKDEADKIAKETSIDLKEIDKQIKVFDGKK